MWAALGFFNVKVREQGRPQAASALGCWSSEVLPSTGVLWLCVSHQAELMPLCHGSPIHHYKEVLGNGNFRYPKNLKHSSKNQTETTKEVSIAGIGIHKHSQTGLKIHIYKRRNKPEQLQVINMATV